jgi:hypothetical protein
MTTEFGFYFEQNLGRSILVALNLTGDGSRSLSWLRSGIGEETDGSRKAENLPTNLKLSSFLPETP